ncbi:MAG: hypothetical protein M3P95_01845 [Actinomycetota bacterium]|nr:hypothetical protein [Actinomycetota bacterium]
MTLVAAAVAVASVLLTYLCCIRPMRRLHCQGRPAPDERELAQLRAEIATLKSTRPGR